MTVTEEEAQQKWCPFAKTGIYGGGGGVAGVNRHVNSMEVYDETRCLGSGCMAWVWSKRMNDVSLMGESQRGYCGMAED